LLPRAWQQQKQQELRIDYAKKRRWMCFFFLATFV